MKNVIIYCRYLGLRTINFLLDRLIEIYFNRLNSINYASLIFQLLLVNLVVSQLLDLAVVILFI